MSPREMEALLARAEQNVASGEYDAEYDQFVAAVRQLLNANREAQGQIARLREALRHIMLTGLDCPADYPQTRFYHDQAKRMIATAAQTLTATAPQEPT